MEHRFDSCHRSHDSTQLGDPSSAVQMEQIVYGKHMTKIKFVLLQEISDFLHGFSFFFHFNRIVKQQSLAHGSTQGIHNTDRDFRIFLHQFLRGDPAAVDASAETGRKSQIQDINPLFHIRKPAFLYILGICLRSRRHCSGAHPLIKLMRIHLMLFIKRFSIHGTAQAHIWNLVFLVE